MNDTDSFEEIQYCPDNYNEFLLYLSDLLKEVHKQSNKNTALRLYTFYCKIQKMIRAEFRKYEKKNKCDLMELQVMVLLGVERILEVELGLRNR